MRKYAHLHCHTVFSVNDALATIKEYVHKMHKFNYEHGEEWYVGIAATEHGKIIKNYIFLKRQYM